MEKLPDKIQSICEPSPEVKKVRGFFTEQLSRIVSVQATEALEKKPLRELFLLYKDAINSSPTAESYKNLTAKLGEEIDNESSAGKEFFREFLLLKLPKELIERQIKENNLESAEEIPLEKLEFLHAARDKAGVKMFLGFHVANLEYDGEVLQSKIESVTVLDGKEIVLPEGNAHDSVSEDGLYKDVFKRGGNIFLYFVEGSTGDLGKTGEDYREAHRPNGWVNTARKLPILFKTNITPNVLEALGVLQHK